MTHLIQWKKTSPTLPFQGHPQHRPQRRHKRHGHGPWEFGVRALRFWLTKRHFQGRWRCGKKNPWYNTYLPGSCECLSLFWCFTKGPRFQLKQGSFGKHAKDTQVLNKGKTQDLIELIAVITRGCIASGNVIPCRRWKLARCCGGI